MIPIDLNTIFNSPEKLKECIYNIKNARNVTSLKTDEEKVIYKIICRDEEKIKDKMKNENYVFDRKYLPEYFRSSEYALFYHKGNVYYKLTDCKKYLAEHFFNYLKQLVENRSRGETDNTWKYISEACPMLIDDNYLRIVPTSCYERNGSNHSDAIIYDDVNQEYVPCEHKFTDSGGVRQTFNGSVRKPTYVTSLNNKEEVMSKLFEGLETTINLDIYDANCEDFFQMVEQEINDKINRRKPDPSKGNGRFDVTNMIKKMEDKTAFKNKKSVQIKIGGDNE